MKSEILAGTKNHTLVKDYLVSTLKALDWHVEEDNFVDTTPIGVKNFTNVIATHDPGASRRVILAAHFDSKYFPSHSLKQVRCDLSGLSCQVVELCNVL